jgi:hypothetical protein
MRLGAAVLIAAGFFGCLVLSIFASDVGWKGLLQIILGFGVGAFICGILMFIRASFVWFAGTLFLMLAALVFILLGWKWTALGAGVSAFDALLLYFAWIRPHTAQPFNHVDYAKEQQRIYEEEKARKAGGPGASPQS